jgi:DNA-directed RNA polymerase sigma subunit (sigma70/sigma32)
MLQVSQYTVSLETLIGKDENSQLSNFIEDEAVCPSLETISHHLLREELE